MQQCDEFYKDNMKQKKKQSSKEHMWCDSIYIKVKLGKI